MMDIFTEAKQRTTAAEVAQQAGVMLKRVGTRLVGLCPLHEEKSGSFYIYEDGSFHCFGCRAHGDAVDLFAKLHNIPLLEAARQLAGNPAGEHTKAAINSANLKRDAKYRCADTITLLIGISNSCKKYLRTYNRDDAWEHPFFVQLVNAIGILDAEIESLENTMDRKKKRWMDARKNA